MNRRDFLLMLSILAEYSTVVDHAHAEQSVPRRIGVLFAGLWTEDLVQAFRQGLRDAGYMEGRDVVIEWRNAKGDFARLPQLARSLADSKVDVIVAGDTPSTQAAKEATTAIPIVMVMIADPVGSGLVTSLAHPGGNITGLTIMAPELSAKRLQLIKEALPTATTIAVLWNPAVPYHLKVIEELKAAAPSLSIELTLVSARTPDQLAPAFLAINRKRAQVVFVIDDAFFSANETTLLGLAAKSRLPLIYASREFATKGALMFYGTGLADQCRQAGSYVDKILKGVKPSEIPIERPTKFELVVNLKTAKALGITIPESILVRADEVIR